MLLDTYYTVRGFRSLVDFRIELAPGVNVLVGPNGSGKTNFIEFLDFLDALSRGGAAHAVSLGGGVARVFSVENFKRAIPAFNCEVSGLARLPDTDQYESEPRYFRFKYSLEIKFNKRESRIYISKERLTFFKVFRAFEQGPVQQQQVGAVQINRSGGETLSEPDIQIGPRIFVETERNPFSYKRRSHKSKNIRDIFDRNDIQALESDQSMLSIRMFFPALDAVRFAIGRGRSYNIIPDKARSPDHISRYGVIERDGTGLSSVLHHLRRLKHSPDDRPSYLFERVPPDGFDMIVHWTSLIFPELSDISITQDLHLGKYIVNLIIHDDRPLKIPLQAASDGTVKWLALVALIITSRGLGCIEEPENFLHPRMQVFLLDLLREHDSASEFGFFILSTHSESLINSCRPDELILFNYGENGTNAARLRDPSKVQAEINKTGFGLGYYYAANAIR